MALDNFRKVNITLNKANQRVLETQIAKAGDVNGRELVVQITNNGKIEDQSGTNLKLNWQHENGNQGSTSFDVIDIKTGKFSVYYPKEMLYKGKVNASIEITSNGRITNSMNFKIIVQADVFNGEAGTVNGVFISLADVNKKLDDREAEYVELKERQTTVENQFNSIQQDITDKDVISAPEIIAARNGKNSLKQRLDSEHQEVSTQLAQTNQLRKISYITPYDYNAVGDGVADDTEALREALYESHIKGTILFFPSGCKCRVTEPLNIRNGEFYDITLNIVGSLPNEKGGYKLDIWGGIKLDSETALFKDATIRGSFSNMSIIGARNDNYHFFDNCTLYQISIVYNNITNFGSFMHDTSLVSVSKITDNMFLTVFNFISSKTKVRGVIDSFITNNYINGGMERNDNVCFGFDDGNGSVISGNFVDYYHTIFKPGKIGSSQIPTSIGNQYQVFLYFYDFENVNGTVVFLSSGDTFNWTSNSALEQLGKFYEEKEVTAEDGSTHIAPTYIFRPRANSSIVIENAKIERQIGNIVFIPTSTTGYMNGVSKASFVGLSRRLENKITYVEGNAPYARGTTYRDNLIEPYFILDVDELPGTKTAWNKFPPGARVRHNGQNYRMVYKYDSTTEEMSHTWIETPEL